MANTLPDYYFRVRENGAQVFRVQNETRNARLELEPLAVVNIRNGDIRVQGDRVLTDADKAEIEKWMETRRDLVAARDLDDIHRTIDHLNLTAHWAQSKASDEALDEVTDALLLAMHDLRTTLVRKMADRMSKSEDD